MTSKADQLRAKAARLAAAQAKTTDPEPAPTEAPERPPVKPVRVRDLPPRDTPVAVRGKPIRSTVDLPPARHHALRAWCDETAVQLGKARVTTQDVMRTLVARVLTDETLARKIRDDLRKGVQ